MVWIAFYIVIKLSIFYRIGFDQNKYWDIIFRGISEDGGG